MLLSTGYFDLPFKTFQCVLLGFSLTADQPRLLPICLETVMGLSRSQQQSEAVNVDVCPRTCPPQGVSTLAGSAAHRYSVRAQSTRSLPILTESCSCCAFA